MRERGFYVVKDEFFADFPDPYLKGNKEERRPHYFALHDAKTGLAWMVPMSSRVDKYKTIIEKRVSCGKPYDTLHICKLDNGVLNVFLLQDMFPVAEGYILSPYTINGTPLMLTSDAEVAAVKKKALRVLNMIHRGVKFTPTQPNVLRIEAELLKKGA